MSPNVPEMEGICATGGQLLVFLFLFFEDVSLMEFIYLLFARMPGESYRRRFRSLMLRLYDVFRARIDSLLC